MSGQIHEGGASGGEGYQPHTSNGPRVRTDVVDVYVFRRLGLPEARPSRPYDAEAVWPKMRPESGGQGGAEERHSESGGTRVEFLQVLRAGEPLAQTWHPVMGHVEAGETAVQCAVREMREELGLTTGERAFMGLWALEQVHPFFIARINAIVMSPRFACEVAEGWSPRLNEEHGEHRWVGAAEIDARFMWPGQRAACREVLSEIVAEGSLSRELLRVDVQGA